MGALMTNTDLTYDDLAEATTWMADRLLASQNENRSLSQKLAAVYGEVAALRCALEFEQECSRELRNRGDHWQVVANEAPPRLGYLPSVIAASPLSLWASCAAPSSSALTTYLKGRAAHHLVLWF